MMRSREIILAAALLLGCESTATSNDDAEIGKIITTELPPITIDPVDAIQAGIDDYTDAFGCEVEITYVPHAEWIKEHEFGTYLAGAAVEGQFTIASEILNNNNYTQYVATHETSHSCLEIPEVNLADPLEFDSGTFDNIGSGKIVGFSGLGLKIEFPHDYGTHQINELEEASAQILAGNASEISGYSSPKYWSWSYRLGIVLDESGISNQDLHDYKSASDLGGLIARIMSKTRDELTVDDYSCVFEYVRSDALATNCAEQWLTVQ